MTLIKNDETLRRFMPNVFATAKGETPLFDKLTPWLIASEQWLKEKICGEDTLVEIVALDDMNVVKMLASQIEVSDAVRCAVPNLDLVSLCGIKEHCWEKYLELRSKVLDI